MDSERIVTSHQVLHTELDHLAVISEIVQPNKPTRPSDKDFTLLDPSLANSKSLTEDIERACKEYRHDQCIELYSRILAICNKHNDKAIRRNREIALARRKLAVANSTDLDTCMDQATKRQLQALEDTTGRIQDALNLKNSLAPGEYSYIKHIVMNALPGSTIGALYDHNNILRDASDAHHVLSYRLDILSGELEFCLAETELKVLFGN